MLGPGHIVRNAQSLYACPVSILIISAVAEDTVKVAIKKWSKCAVTIFANCFSLYYYNYKGQTF